MSDFTTFDLRDIVWVLDKATLRDFLLLLEEQTWVSYDLETTGLDEFAARGGTSNGGVPARIALGSFTFPQERSIWLVPMDHPESPLRPLEAKIARLAAQRLAMPGKKIVGHNVKFDARYTYARSGVSIARQVAWDSMVAAHLQDENRSLRLEALAAERFGVSEWGDFDLSEPGAVWDVPLIQLGEYAARDTFYTWKLGEAQMAEMFVHGHTGEPQFPDEIEEARLGRLATYVSMPTVRTLIEVEQRGIALDAPVALAERERYADKGAELDVALRGRYGDFGEVSWAPTSKWWREWSSRAVAAGDLRIVELTKSRVPKWDKHVLKKLAREGSEVAGQLLELRDYLKRVEFLDSWHNHMSPDGRIHASFNVGSVVTGRLSSSGPNLQQVNRRLRSAFIAAPGKVLIDLDYGQIEMRVAAFITRSAPLIKAFAEGMDTHRMMASWITGKSLEDISGDERQAGKSANFGLLFGMAAYGYQRYAEAAYGVILTEEEAIKTHAAFFDLWDGIAQWHQDSIAKVRRDGQVKSPIGRVRRLGSAWHRTDDHEAERRAINSPVQGFASDIMQIASALISGDLGHPGVPGAEIVATVHDSILIEVDEERAEEVRDACIEVMTQDVLEILAKLDCHFDVPLVADAKIGRSWG